MSRTALITGASGFAGQHLATLLASQGWDVVALTHRRPFDGPAVHQQAVEVTDAQAVAAAVAAARPDAVFHLAAIVDTIETPDVQRLYAVNTLGTAAVVEAVRAHAPQARVVFASSAFAYGHVDGSRLPVSELEPLAPVTPYGASKAAAEAIVGQFVRSGGDAIVARTFTHTGPGHVGRYALADWAAQLAEIRAGRRAPKIVCGNLDVERDYLDVRDVVGAYAELCASGITGATYNVGSGEPVSMRDLIEQLIAVADVEVELEVDRARFRVVDQASFFADVSRLRSIGWRPHFDLRRTLTDLDAFWRRRVVTTAVA